MPTYDYQCENCGHELEKFQSITAPALRKCPACGKMKLNRLIGTGSGIIFKGSGFYQTDYRSDSYKQSRKKNEPAAAKTSSDKKDSKTGQGTTETKPAKETPAPAPPAASENKPE